MIARSRMAVILGWKEKKESLILARENKKPTAGRRSLERGRSHQRFPSWTYQGQAACASPSAPTFPNRRQSTPLPGTPTVPSDVSCASHLKDSSPLQMGRDVLLCFPRDA